MAWAWINGRLVAERRATVSVFDRGFLYGDGVYETLRVYDGRPFLFRRHAERLFRSAKGIGVRVPVSRAGLERALAAVLRKNGWPEAVARVTLTRGAGGTGFDVRGAGRPTLVVSVRPFRPYPERFFKRGIRVAVVSVRRNSARAQPPSIKSTSCLNGILAKTESVRAATQEAILLDERGFVAEGAVSNVFAVFDRRIRTPRADGEILSGVTRREVMRLARAAGYDVREADLRPNDLARADEVFLTNTTMEIMPVTTLVFAEGGRRAVRVGSGTPGSVTTDLRRRFQSARRSGRLV